MDTYPCEREERPGQSAHAGARNGDRTLSKSKVSHQQPQHTLPRRAGTYGRGPS